MNRISSDLKSFLSVVKEFIKALGQKRTYDISKNWYCFFGILWGLPIPIVTVTIDLHASGLSLTLHNIIELTKVHPFQLFFILHPLFFAIVFGAMGTVKYDKEQEIEQFEKSILHKNKQLKEANKKLRELDKLKSNFLSMVSHELRTPLTTIQGYITFLKTEKAGTLNTAQKEYLKISEEEAELLNHLLEELLDLSRIERGKFKVNLAGINLQDVVTKAMVSLQILANKQKITVENNLPKNLSLVLADKEKILQVITNLLENALKFNQRKGKICISTVAGHENNKITFCISDTGIGIEKNKLNKIFDKFYQCDSLEKRRRGGFGLGLAISKSILELHHGKIWVESSIGVGSKFFFELIKF